MSSSIFCRRGALGCSRAHFNPRTPCGVRRQFPNGTLPTAASFQSTHPSRGATAGAELLAVPGLISIHAPLAECDLPGVVARGRSRDFNPRTPCGVRRQFPNGTLPTAASFQSTHPSRGATQSTHVHRRTAGISIHAPLAGCDSTVFSAWASPWVFQSTHPSRGATAKIHKFLCVLLWQKALLRQFHTKRRLLKRFSTYKRRKKLFNLRCELYGKNLYASPSHYKIIGSSGK